MSLAEWLRQRGLSTDFGAVWVLDDNNNFKFQPWATRWATFRRNFFVLWSIIKQITCWHPQWVHNGSGKQRLPLGEAYKWQGRPMGSPELRDSLPMVRHNWKCSRCRRISHRYTPDWSPEAVAENNLAMNDAIRRKYGPQIGDASTYPPVTALRGEHRND